MYFDSNRSVLQVNTLLAPEGNEGGLQFSKPKRWKSEWTSYLAKKGRFQEITIKDLTETGATHFCWLRPGESIYGKDDWQMHSQPEVSHGGFAYLFHSNVLSTDQTECRRDCYFGIVSGDQYIPVPVDDSRTSQYGFESANQDGLSRERSRTASVSDNDIQTYPAPGHWTLKVPLTSFNESRLWEIRDAASLKKFQDLVSFTHKFGNNWTRDRGKTPDGKYKPVPKAYTVERVWRNEHPRLWARYSGTRAAIVEECSSSIMKPLTVESCKAPFIDLDGLAVDRASCNECRLFHGSSQTACGAICKGNFQLEYAGLGATWKATGDSSGTPLYGFGAYFAEHFTKADEYAKPTQLDPNLYCILVCRVIAGRVRSVETNDFNPQQLQAEVLDGPFHSVLGDRVSILNKPFREVVVYNKHQIYPEYLVEYRRCM